VDNLLYKYHKTLLVVAIVLTSVAISIRGSNGEVKLVLGSYPALITIMVTLSLFLVAIYFRMNERKNSMLTDQIKELSRSKNEGTEALLERLTERQREVYDLIVSGKTNKEIMNELFIEQSTLKSHINQIYKKLNIKNRRMLKTNAKN
jgi:DNA-binding CsgD family transcriptional regulator